MAAFKILGITQDKDSCDCCGKKNLKKTVVLAPLDADGNSVAEVFYGVSCAAKALGYRKKTFLENKASEIQKKRDYAKKKIAEYEAFLTSAKGLDAFRDRNPGRFKSRKEVLVWLRNAISDLRKVVA